MSSFSALERAYLTAIQSATEFGAETGETPDEPREGFSEAPIGYDANAREHAIAMAEAACLAHKAETESERLQKLNFILARMRELTDETEEFDAYRTQLLSDLT